MKFIRISDPNCCRDVQWSEDKMIMGNRDEDKVVASFITIATNLSQIPQNYRKMSINYNNPLI